MGYAYLYKTKGLRGHLSLLRRPKPSTATHKRKSPTLSGGGMSRIHLSASEIKRREMIMVTPLEELTH
ncbi:hypothetical protein KIN20_012474 [Parelaphostrongylus tenuis]|uniref:Uncharacterized protein n=1 Tax=Parelaphostrongylus tenuis TaxID=148309 RepID=A0AAD5QLU0_PARTN|nr:hypothetical protein KIN20_012474 [Parelaphostrongylus tenuis]